MGYVGELYAFANVQTINAMPGMPEVVYKHFKVIGRVQGVFFRANTQRQARLLKLTGWVRNCPDGSVELVACGTEKALKVLSEWLQKGPDLARVDRVIVDEAESADYRDFEIR